MLTLPSSMHVLVLCLDELYMMTQVNNQREETHARSTGSFRVGGMSRKAFKCAAAGQCICPPILGVTDHSLCSACAESTVAASPCLIAMSQRHSVQCSAINPSTLRFKG